MQTDLWLMTLIWALPLGTALLARGRWLDRAVRPAAIGNCA